MTFVLTGVETEYFRLQGEPHLNYNKDGTEWSANFILTDEHVEELKNQGMAKAYLKETKDDKRPMIKFTKPATLKSGAPAKRPVVRDSANKAWASENLIGNGSKVDIVVALNEMKSGPNQGKLKPTVLKVVVKDWIPYEPDDGISYTKESNQPETTATTSTPEEVSTPDIPEEGGDW